MARTKPTLSRREQEILDIVYAAVTRPPPRSARRCTSRRPTPPSARPSASSSPRGTCASSRTVRATTTGPRSPREAARRSELQHVLRTFFGGSTESALATLLDIQPGELDDEERRRLKRLIDKAAKEGR